MIHGRYEMEINRKSQKVGRRRLYFWLVALVVFGPVLWVLLRVSSTQ